MADFGDTGEELTNDNKPRTFEDGQIYCPHNGRNNGNIKPCQIFCNGDDLMRRPKIYAVEGFNDVNITSQFYIDPWCIRGATIHCAENFNKSCPITNVFPFQCQDYIHQIEDVTCEQYTISTEIPTSQPTINPTTPTQSP